jgi:hypothetical protein
MFVDTVRSQKVSNQQMQKKNLSHKNENTWERSERISYNELEMRRPRLLVLVLVSVATYPLIKLRLVGNVVSPHLLAPKGI